MAGYTRNDTLNNIADGNVISAADLDGEFDALDAAFDEATGHVHDGTANNGAPITKVGPAQDLVVSTGAVTPKTDNAVDLGSSSFEFKDLYIDGTANIDSLVADTADINGGSIDGVTIGTNSVVTDLRVDNLQLNGNTISSTDTNGNIVLAPNGTGDVVPGTDDTYDLGSSSAEWKDLFIDGTANIDSLVADTADINAGTIDNTIIGGSTAAAGTFTTATATTGNITNVNATTVDATNVEVTNVKAKDGTASVTIADSTGVVTVNAAPVMTALTASQAVFTTSGKALVSNPITGTGNVVMSTSPTLVTPILGTPQSVTLANATGLPVSTGISGLGTGVATALAVNVGTAGSPVVNGGALGTPSSGTVTNLTGTASININGTVGATTPAAGTFTTLTANGNTTLGDATSDTITATGRFNTDLVPSTDDARDLGTTALKWRQAYATNFTENGFPVVSQTDIGSAPNQIPLNQYLGNLAYQNADAIAGNVTIGGSVTASGPSVISVNSASDALRITQVGAGNALLVEDSANPDATPFVIDASGFVVAGYTASVVNAGSVIAPRLQVHGLGGGSATTAATSWSTGVNVGPAFLLSRSEGGTIGTQTIVDSGDQLGRLSYAGSDGTAFIEAARIEAAVDGTPGTNDMPGRLVFSTTADGASTPTERMRIDSSGNVLVGTTSGTKHTFVKNNSAAGCFEVQNSASSNPIGLGILYPNADPNSSASAFLEAYGFSGGFNQRFAFYSNGGLANYSANDVNLSDRREKTNFAPAKNYLETICAIPVQTFNYIDQNLEEDPGLTLGVVAQDVQEVAPEFVMESNWGTEEEPKMRLSIYQTDLQYALMKCIQELKAELDTVKAELAALKGN
jgi:hypothetical protein